MATRGPRKVAGYLKEYAKAQKMNEKLSWSQERLHTMWAKMNMEQRAAVMAALPKNAFVEVPEPEGTEATLDPS